MGVIIEISIEIGEFGLRHLEPETSETDTFSIPDPHWRALIQAALHRHRSDPTARYLQLATVDGEHQPQNRTVAFRGFVENTDQLQFAVDSRSEKLPQILTNPKAQACWYFRKTREQFRITGRLIPILAPSLMLHPEPETQLLRERLWDQISERSRALWFWPEPKGPRAEAAEFVSKVPKETAVPDTFVLLLLDPTEVDHLALKGDEDYPQVRHLYVRQDGSPWQKYPVNP